jgi:hypothetical protein
VTITPLAAQAAAVLDGAGCGQGGWQVDSAQSVAGGCLFLPSIAECPAEYDLVRQDGDRICFGARMASLCSPEGRPSAIDEHAMVRVTP